MSFCLLKNGYKGTFLIGTSQRISQNHKMKILFLSIVVVTTALNLMPRDLAIYDKKLRTYQNMTGIDELTFNEIWEAGITNGKNFEILFDPDSVKMTPNS